MSRHVRFARKNFFCARIDKTVQSQVLAFLETAHQSMLDRFDRQQWDQAWGHSYPQWKHGGRAWQYLELGGTSQVRVLMWYHHVHKSGSREWRPTIIMQALLEAVATQLPAATNERKIEGAPVPEARA